MKILSIAMIAILALSFITPYAFAEETSDGVVDNATEDVVSENTAADTSAETTATEAELELNESAGTGKIAWKQVQLWLTFNQERKLEREMDLARLRLIQAKIAARNNDSAAMEKALEAHERIMERAKTRMEALKLADGDKANETAAKLVGLERAIQVHERRIAFISNVLANANLTEAQREKLELKLEKVKGVTSKLEELNQAKQEQIKTRLMAVKNMTEQEADQLMEQAKERVKEKLGKSSGEEAENESQ
jgi:hypothetical protein